MKYEVSLSGGSDRARQCLRLEVLRPDGKPCRQYARNFLLGAKGQPAGFHLALNDPAGTWRLVARDLASGATAEAKFTVE